MSGTNGGFGRNRPRFSPQDLDAIFAAWDAGESANSIARRYGCHPSAVRYHLLSTLRVVPISDRHDHEQPAPATHRCVRCGIDTDRPGMCVDCIDVESGAA